MKNYVNLLPLKHRRAALLQRLLIRWCAAWAVVTVVFVAVLWVNQAYQAKTAAAVSDREITSKPVISTAKANKRMREEVRRFDRRETIVGQLRDDKPALCFLAVISKSARLCDGRVVVRDLQFKQNSEPQATPVGKGKTAKQPAPPAAETLLTIEGDALDNLAIAKFAAALRDTALFRDVELKLSVDKPSPNRPMHSFIVRCEI